MNRRPSPAQMAALTSLARGGKIRVMLTRHGPPRLTDCLLEPSGKTVTRRTVAIMQDEGWVTPNHKYLFGITPLGRQILRRVERGLL